MTEHERAELHALALNVVQDERLRALIMKALAALAEHKVPTEPPPHPEVSHRKPHKG